MTTSLQEKVRYARSQGQTREHTCHWPGCDKQVPPAMWGCRAHWFTLPRDIRNGIWEAYVPGQEVTLTPSAKYLAAAKRAMDWIAQREADRRAQGAGKP